MKSAQEKRHKEAVAEFKKLFPKAAALVTDIGAPLSHAVIVARELGIPAVVSCQCASGVLKTGNRVKIDGTAGTVTLLDV